MTEHRAPSPPLPAGLQTLLALAAADPRFAEVLARDREAAVTASGVALSPAEAAVLASVPTTALRDQIAGVEDAMPEPARRVFLQRAGQALVTLGVIGAFAAPADAAEAQEADRWLVGGGGSPGTVTGSRPDQPRPDQRSGALIVDVVKLECKPAAVLPIVRRILRAYQAGFRLCYLQGLKLDSKLEGKVEYTYQISKEGRVTAARIVRDEVGSSIVASCSRARLLALRYPTQEAETAVELTLRFLRKRP